MRLGIKARADAVRQNLRHLEQSAVKYVLILSGDQLYRMDFREMIYTHERSKGRRDDFPPFRLSRSRLRPGCHARERRRTRRRFPGETPRRNRSSIWCGPILPGSTLKGLRVAGGVALQAWASIFSIAIR